MKPEYLLEHDRMIKHKHSKVSRKRIFIVDDHPVIREGTSMIVNQEGDLVLCGAAATPAEALEGISKAQPDVAVVDLSLGGHSGLELLKILRAHFPKLPVVVYSMHEETVYAQRALANGACAYVTKRQPVTDLLAALRHAAAGGGRRSTADAEAESLRAVALPLGRLTDREQEVFELRGQGWTADHIAAQLHISRKTVDTHMEHIKHKLNLPNAAELLHSAVQWMQSKRI
jgi:DNA-binding NarL/FixJ family response regulator